MAPSLHFSKKAFFVNQIICHYNGSLLEIILPLQEVKEEKKDVKYMARSWQINLHTGASRSKATNTTQQKYYPDDSIALNSSMPSRPEPNHVQSTPVHLHLLMWTCPWWCFALPAGKARPDPAMAVGTQTAPWPEQAARNTKWAWVTQAWHQRKYLTISPRYWTLE